MSPEKFPLISVIIPIYNSEKYLSKCVYSILNQNYKNLEVVLVNDGSADNSLSICEKIKLEDDRITIIDIPNGGVSNARNTGLLKAKGEYIQFIDSDDFVDKNYIKTLYDLIVSTKTELAICSIESYDFDGNKFDEWTVKNGIIDFDSIDKNLFLELIQKFLLFGPVNKLYIKKIITDNQIEFDTSLSYGEDLLFNFEYFNHINTISIKAIIQFISE